MSDRRKEGSRSGGSQTGKNGETEDILTKKPIVVTTATKESSLGDYPVTVSGAEAQNYKISYEEGTLKVTDADAVVVTADVVTVPDVVMISSTSSRLLCMVRSF